MGVSLPAQLPRPGSVPWSRRSAGGDSFALVKEGKVIARGDMSWGEWFDLIRKGPKDPSGEAIQEASQIAGTEQSKRGESSPTPTPGVREEKR